MTLSFNMEIVDNIATCNTKEEFLKAKLDKMNNPSLPYHTIELICDKNIQVIILHWDKQKNKWV